MKQLLLMRHAKSDWSNDRLADHDRPLNQRGRHDAPLMGQLLSREEWTPDLILSSSARRTRETASLVAQACDYAGTPQATRDLYLAEPDDYLAVIQGTPPEVQRLLLVGHNPGLEELVAQLSGQHERMPTAAVALFSLPAETWAEVDEAMTGELVGVFRPKEVN